MAAVVVAQPLPQQSSSDLVVQSREETLLQDILNELDRERRRRAELEVQVRTLLEEKLAAEPGEDEMTISRKHYVALQTELSGYRKLIEVMTGERPALAHAVQTTMRQKILQKQHEFAAVVPPKASPSLPLHVIRLLEIMPWDSRSNEYAFATEEMYEFQFYNQKQRKWTTESPRLFKTLPTEEPKPGVNANGGNQKRKLLALPFFVGAAGMAVSPPSSCVLTNQAITKLYDLKKGYPLPENGGTWQWVGGWRVQKRINLSHDFSDHESSRNINQPRVDCDDEGWSYAVEATHFLLNPTETCWDHPGKVDNKPGHVLRPVRRRKWTRQRALVDYPYASESTRHFLALMAQLKSATLAANKISEQLVETKVSLTEAEASVMHCKDELTGRVRSLKQMLESKKKLASPKEARARLQKASAAASKMETEVLKLLYSSFQDTLTC